MKKLIGIVGFIGSGKGTVSDYLVDNYGFKTESFAKPVKDTASVVFGWDRALLEGNTKESREWREQLDGWWATALDIPNLTPRYMLQQIGTDIFRNNFHQDIWIKSLEKRLLDSNNNNIILSDCRFKNEVETIKQLGGIIIRTKRGLEPEWFNDALLINAGQKEGIIEGVHPSEYSWIGCDIDHTIDNDTTLEELYFNIDKYMYEIL